MQGRHPEHHFLRFATATARGERAVRGLLAPECVSLQVEGTPVSTGASLRRHARGCSMGRSATAPALRSGLERLHGHAGDTVNNMCVSGASVQRDGGLDTTLSAAQPGQLSSSAHAATGGAPARTEAGVQRRLRRLQTTQAEPHSRCRLDGACSRDGASDCAARHSTPRSP